jgi:vitamin B12 transporter
MFLLPGSQRLQFHFAIRQLVHRLLFASAALGVTFCADAVLAAGEAEVPDATETSLESAPKVQVQPARVEKKQDAPPEQTVTVTGQRPIVVYGQRDSTVASSVVLREQLERPGATASDVLATLPGVSILRVGTAAEFASASVRGADSRQIPVYLANIPLNDDVSGSADLSMLPLWMVQRIEVYRGASPQDGVRAGLGGAVYFEPLRPTKAGVGALVSVGSFGERGAAIRAAVGSRQASSLFAVRYNRADNDYSFLNDQGQRFELNETLERRQNADYSDVDAWSISEWSTHSGIRITSVMQGMRREQGATSMALSPARHARAERRRLLAGLSAIIPCNGTRECSLTLMASALNATTTLMDASKELRITGGDWMDQRGRRFVQSAQLKLTPSREFAVSALLFHADELLQLRHSAAAPRDAKLDELGLSGQAVAFADRSFSPAVLVSSRCVWSQGEFLRLSQVVQRDNTTCTLAPPDMRGGLRYQVNPRIKLLSNFGRFTQIPSLGQLYGVNSAVSGNAELQPEVSYNLDVGMRAEAGGSTVRVDWEAFGFARWASKLIQYKRTSLNTVSPFNIGRARFLGVEAAVSALVFGWIQTRTAVTLLDPRRLGVEADENAILPLRARSQIAQSITFVGAFPQLGVGNTAASVHYRHQASRYMDPEGLVVLPGQHRFDADVRLEVPKIGVRFMLAVNNLLDNRMLDLLGLPLPGRSLNASLEGNLH